jgi:hypothetical protein
LTRREKARQAISFVLASRRDEWWSIAGATVGEPRKSGPSVGADDFDPYVTARMERVLTDSDSKWQFFFQENKINPLVIHYEDLAASYAGTIISVLKWLDISGADTVSVPPPRLRRQSDANTEEWLARYNAFKQTGGSLPETPDMEGARGPLSQRMERIFGTIRPAWKEWIGQSKTLNAKDETILAVLTGNGYTQAAAVAEVERAKSDPYLLGAVRAGQRMQKGVCMLNALGQLARLDSGIRTVERRSRLSRDEFRDRYYAANRPVILTGLMIGWQAMTRWTPQYLKSIAGDQTIEVMMGRDADPKYEMNARVHRQNLRFADYIDMVYSGKVTNDYYLVANNGFLQRPEMRTLLDDFTPFSEYLRHTEEGRQCFLWFGPAGTVTPLHRDTSNILIAQVAGRKRYRMIPASQWQYLYNNEGVFSDVDCARPDLERYPEFRKATVTDVIVEPGEVLFMPVGWWHHVLAVDVSITVSFTAFVFPNHFTWGQ